MNDFLKSIAPTVASALLGPLGGIAVSALGSILGVSDATTEKVTQAFHDGKLTPDQLTQIKQLEMQYQNEEKERGFKYAELAFKDRDSARQANVTGGVQKPMFIMSIILLIATLGTEIWVLFNGYPDSIPEIIVGRVLGLMDAVAMMVLAYHYGTTSGSIQKTELLAQSTPVK